jgi:CheY-like chemotaxis protein
VQKYGEEGLQMVRTQAPDVIILDLQMPVIDGFAVMKELVADPRANIIPTIVSTSLTINAELKARLSPGTRVVSKNTISRESVSVLLSEATRVAP